MTGNAAVGFDRGQTAYQGATPALEGGYYRGNHATGTKIPMKDIDQSTRGVQTSLSNHDCDMLVCRNESGGTVARRTVVVLAADLKTITDATPTVTTPRWRLGVIDDQLVAGVVDHDTCYVHVGGPCRALVDFSGGAGTAGDPVTVNTSGKFVAAPANGSDDATFANAMGVRGHLLAAAATDDTTERVFLHRIL